MTDQNVLDFIDKRIETYNNRANAKGERHVEEFRASAHVLAVLRGDLVAGLHIPDEPRPVVPDCLHTNEKSIGGGEYGPPAFECIDCFRVRPA